MNEVADWVERYLSFIAVSSSSEVYRDKKGGGEAMELA